MVATARFLAFFAVLAITAEAAATTKKNATTNATTVKKAASGATSDVLSFFSFSIAALSALA